MLQARRGAMRDNGLAALAMLAMLAVASGQLTWPPASTWQENADKFKPIFPIASGPLGSISPNTIATSTTYGSTGFFKFQVGDATNANINGPQVNDYVPVSDPKANTWFGGHNVGAASSGVWLNTAAPNSAGVYPSGAGPAYAAGQYRSGSTAWPDSTRTQVYPGTFEWYRMSVPAQWNQAYIHTIVRGENAPSQLASYQLASLHMAVYETLRNFLDKDKNTPAATTANIKYSTTADLNIAHPELAASAAAHEVLTTYWRFKQDSVWNDLFRWHNNVLRNTYGKTRDEWRPIQSASIRVGRAVANVTLNFRIFDGSEQYTDFRPNITAPASTTNPPAGGSQVPLGSYQYPTMAFTANVAAASSYTSRSGGLALNLTCPGASSGACAYSYSVPSFAAYPQFPSSRTFLIPNSTFYQYANGNPSYLAVGPNGASTFTAAPAPNSAQYLADLAEVRDYGSDGDAANYGTKRAGGDDRALKGLFWWDPPAPGSPSTIKSSFGVPGHWSWVAINLAIAKGTELLKEARLHALLHAALADAAIVTWNLKYSNSFGAFWRPSTAILFSTHANIPSDLASSGGVSNANTITKWKSLIPIPAHPEYPSGHSAAAGAAAKVLGDFFGGDATSFDSVAECDPGQGASTTSAANAGYAYICNYAATDSTGKPIPIHGYVRSFDSFNKAGLEVSDARVFTGVHFRQSCDDGFYLGKVVGSYIGSSSGYPGRSVVVAASSSSSSSSSSVTTYPYAPLEIILPLVFGGAAVIGVLAYFSGKKAAEAAQAKRHPKAQLVQKQTDLAFTNDSGYKFVQTGPAAPTGGSNV